MANDFVNAVLLGLVEGLTEFLPISSTGHLILLGEVLGFKGPPGRVFEVSIQLGAILGVCWTYCQRLTTAVRQSTTVPAQRNFLLAIVIAFLPAMVLGAFLHSTIKTYLFNSTTVAIALVCGGIALLLTEKYARQPFVQRVEDIGASRAFRLGLFQALALFPGVSRSGATIAGGLLMGFDRKLAAEFSFFLAIPTMAAATAYDLFKNADGLTMDGMALITAGFAAAFVAAIFTLRFAIAFVVKYGFAPFAYYRIAIGSVLLLSQLF